MLVAVDRAVNYGIVQEKFNQNREFQRAVCPMAGMML